MLLIWLKIKTSHIHGFNPRKPDTDLKKCKFDLVILSEDWTRLDSYVPDYGTFCVHGKRRSKIIRQPGEIAVFAKKYILNILTRI